MNGLQVARCKLVRRKGTDRIRYARPQLNDLAEAKMGFFFPAIKPNPG